MKKTSRTLLMVSAALLVILPVGRAQAQCPCTIMNTISQQIVQVGVNGVMNSVIGQFMNMLSQNLFGGTVPAAASGSAGAFAQGVAAQRTALTNAQEGSVVVEETRDEMADSVQEMDAMQSGDNVVTMTGTLEGLPKAVENVERARQVLGDIDTNYHVGAAGPGQPTSGNVEKWLVDRVKPYCQKESYGGTLRDFCENETTPGEDDYQPDITDYSQFLEQKSTLALLDDGGAPKEPDSATSDLGKVITFKRLVIGTPALSRATASLIREGRLSEAYLAVRAAAAKRSVVENSLNNIIAMKAEGNEESKERLTEVIKRANIPGLSSDEEIGEMIGDKPSYDAQMEVLTRTLYQSPDFFDGLLEHEADLQRQLIFMNGIQLIQDRDTAKSAKRIEMLLSQLLEDELYAYKSQRVGR
ncbi:MAG: hypothetical protein GC136_02575 [Alphaproteobacteria bacterium]|nr:hypothetical protein [Alphaproteobacteria bacterium]